MKKLLLVILALALPMTIQACYSTAVKGTPVKELAVATDEEHAKIQVRREKQREELAAMSAVDANKAFLEIDGIPEYRIGSDDILEINSRVADKVTTSTVTVDSRGRLSYLFLDDIVVDGLTPSQLDHVLTRKLSAYIRKPRIDVLVKEYKSKSALILGELSALRAPHAYSAASGKTFLKGKTTLMDLIVQSGGYTITADIKDVKLIRGGKTYIINLYDIIERGDQDMNVIIDDGDVVLMQYVNTADDGDMVAVWLREEREATLKRFYRERGLIRLQPANEQMQPIYVVPENVEIQGRVIGVIRRLG